MSHSEKQDFCSLYVLYSQYKRQYAEVRKGVIKHMDIVKTGRFLQELRKEKRLTQEQIAEQMGVARRTVSRWETGSNMPDLDILLELSDLYEVDLQEILSGERKVSR